MKYACFADTIMTSRGCCLAKGSDIRAICYATLIISLWLYRFWTKISLAAGATRRFQPRHSISPNWSTRGMPSLYMATTRSAMCFCTQFNCIIFLAWIQGSKRAKYYYYSRIYECPLLPWIIRFWEHIWCLNISEAQWKFEEILCVLLFIN
jgi:hypothetical protein